MRLICPNCDAEYEVDDGLVPPEGRDVQCSNCTTTWFQPFEAPDGGGSVADAIGAATRANLAARQPSVSDADLEIIKGEVERETQARAASRQGDPLESQSDLGLTEAPAKTRETPPTVPPVNDETLSVSTDGELAPAPRRSNDVKSAKLPDIEEINETLKPEVEEAKAAAEAQMQSEEQYPRSQGSSGFRLGFGFMLLVCLALLLLYIYAPQISDRVPALAGALESYVSMINGFRAWLDRSVAGLVDRMTAASAEN